MARVKLSSQQDLIEIPDAEAQEIKNKIQNGVLKSSDWIDIGSSLCKVSMIRSIAIEAKDELLNEKYKERAEYEKKWNEEQERLKNQTPEEKAFRCYKCYFSVYYLLRVGYTNFLGKGGWENKFDGDAWFRKFDFRIDKKLRDNLISEITDWFKKNNAVWCPRELYAKFLPKKEHFSPLFG